MSYTPHHTYPYLGFGLGLRKEHFDSILAYHPNVDWFEILTENYLVSGGKPRDYLQKISEQYPLVMHGVSLSIGSMDALNKEYLQQVKTLASDINAIWISDHLCWTGVDAHNTHDLLPLPYTKEAIKHVVERIQQVQDYLGQQILIENVSSYIHYQQSVMTEWEFIQEISEQADCLLLLDINNIYVSAINHDFDPLTYLHAIPIERVQQFHLAGHSDFSDYIIDTHDAPVCDAVWDLYAQAVKHFGEVSCMIERDGNIPTLDKMLEELDRAKMIANDAKK